MSRGAAAARSATVMIPSSKLARSRRCVGSAIARLAGAGQPGVALGSEWAAGRYGIWPGCCTIADSSSAVHPSTWPFLMYLVPSVATLLCALIATLL